MVYDQILQIITYIDQNLTILASYALSIILISVFFDDLYRLLNFKENFQNLPVIKQITSFHIFNKYRPFRYFDHFLSYLLALVVAEAVLVVFLAVSLDLILEKYSSNKIFVVLGIILISYFAFVYGYHKRKFSDL